MFLMMITFLYVKYCEQYLESISIRKTAILLATYMAPVSLETQYIAGGHITLL